MWLNKQKKSWRTRLHTSRKFGRGVLRIHNQRKQRQRTQRPQRTQRQRTQRQRTQRQNTQHWMTHVLFLLQLMSGSIICTELMINMCNHHSSTKNRIHIRLLFPIVDCMVNATMLNRVSPNMFSILYRTVCIRTLSMLSILGFSCLNILMCAWG